MADLLSLRVLLIEDDPDDQLLTREVLSDAAPGRYVVSCVATYDEALVELERGQYDVVLLDYRLGAHDGLELLREAIRRGCRIPTIVLTGQSDREVDEAALRAGAVDYLVKAQLTPDLLDRAIRYALERRAAENRERELAREQAARAEAEAANRARQELIAVLSHDLKNPLTAIKGQAQMLQRRLARGQTIDPERLAASLRSIEAAVAGASMLVGDLLDAVRLEAGQPLDLQPGPVDLVDLARRAVAAQEQTTEAHRFRFEAPPHPIEGVWDGERLERVLANLLSNAVKYSPAGGEITVRVWQEGDTALVMVRDQGVGIPAADLPRIFERYHRAGNVVGKIAGTGLGLAGAKQIVAQHGGMLTVESREGVGSTFTVRLPVTVGSESLPRPASVG